MRELLHNILMVLPPYGEILLGILVIVLVAAWIVHEEEKP